MFQILYPIFYLYLMTIENIFKVEYTKINNIWLIVVLRGDIMLNRNIFVAVSDSENYSVFLENLDREYENVQLFYQKESLIKSVEFLSHNQSYLDNNIFVIFSETEFITPISKYLKENLDDLSYVLICLEDKKQAPLNICANIFDHINAGSPDFDIILFMNRLESEVLNKSRITALKIQIREFYEIGKRLSSERDIFKLFDMIINTSLKITRADAVTLYLVADKHTDEWCSIKDSDYQDKIMKFVISKNMSIVTNLQSFTTPITKKSIYGYTAINGKALRIDNTNNISPEMEYKHDNSFDMKTGYKTVSMLTVPMKDRDNNVIGVIQLINKKKEASPVDYRGSNWSEKIIPFDYFDELTMNSVAGQAAVALENNLLYKNINQLLEKYVEQNEKLTVLSSKILKAHEEERKRIAREIHDGPAQSAACLALKIELCKKHLERGSMDDLSAELDKLGNDVRSTVKEIRSIIYDLKPSYLDDGLFAAMQNHISVFQDNTGLEVDYNAAGADLNIEYYISSTIFRILQEALTNISKHAQANRATVSIEIADNELNLNISDDGKGFDVTSLTEIRHVDIERGFGIEGMMERVELINGSINIDSAINKGTAISIKVPINKH